jgi:hypothetical protein
MPRPCKTLQQKIKGRGSWGSTCSMTAKLLSMHQGQRPLRLPPPEAIVTHQTQVTTRTGCVSTATISLPTLNAPVAKLGNAVAKRRTDTKYSGRLAGMVAPTGRPGQAERWHFPPSNLCGFKARRGCGLKPRTQVQRSNTTQDGI